MTQPQAKLLASLPDFFYIFEDFAASDMPPTEIKDLDGRTLRSFGRGEARAFSSLCQKGLIERLGDKESNGVPYGKR